MNSTYKLTFPNYEAVLDVMLYFIIIILKKSNKSTAKL